MKQFVEKYSTLFEQRVLRERIIISCVVLALVYLIFDFAFFQPVFAKRDEFKKQIHSAQSELKVIQTEKDVLIQGFTKNPSIAKQREITQLKQRIASLDGEINSLSEGLIEAEKLPQVVRELVTHDSGLRLLGLRVDSPKALTLKSGSDDEESVSSAGIFKHSVVFRLQGSFFDLMRYLQTLENSEWHFYWESLDYEVDSYPQAVAQIEAYTLSTQRGFIGE